MPCYTLISITIKDKKMAELALAQMKVEGTVIKKGNDLYEVQLAGGKTITQDFKDKFLQEYGVQVTTAKAKREGYTVSRHYNEQTKEVEVVLRQY